MTHSNDPNGGLRNRTTLAALVVAAIAGGCASQIEHRKAVDLMAQGQTISGLESLKKASDLDRENVRYRADYINKRDEVVRTLIESAEAQRAADAHDAAAKSYENALRADPTNQRALQGLQQIEAERRALLLLAQGERALQSGQFDQAREVASRIVRETPRFERARRLLAQAEDRLEEQRQAREEAAAAKASFRRPVSLSFRDAQLRMVFEALSKVANINVIVDREVKSDLRTTIFVKDAAIEDAIDVILMQNQLEKRVLNNNTILIYPATPARQKELAELRIRTFQLSNVDAVFMGNILKTMLKTKDIVTDAKTNVLIMRDTPEAITLAERLVAANDLPDPEVMLEVEVLEVASSRINELGLKLPTGVTVSTPSASSGSWTIGDLRALTRNDLLVSPMSATLNVMLQDGDTNILASPRIRTRNREKARILVGDRLPQITNLISPQQAGQNSVITGSIQYVDVGIKLDVEPQVYGDGDVGIKLNLEVSNVTDTIQTESGRAYQIGTRSAQTTLRLRDGETQVMAGLISDSDRNSAQKVPGLGQLPVLGRLFSSNRDDIKKTEIVLSITPRIIRPLATPDLKVADTWSGSEGNLRTKALRIDPVGALRTGPGSTSGTNVPAPAAAGQPSTDRSAAGAPARADDATPTVGNTAQGGGSAAPAVPPKVALPYPVLVPRLPGSASPVPIAPSPAPSTPPTSGTTDDAEPAKPAPAAPKN